MVRAIGRRVFLAGTTGITGLAGAHRAPAEASVEHTGFLIEGGHLIHIETSRQDPFCAANLGFARQLRRAGVAADLAVLPGPHDQPWLREVGTLEMLLWHDRALGERP